MRVCSRSPLPRNRSSPRSSRRTSSTRACPASRSHEPGDMRRYDEGRAQAEKTYDKYKDRPVVDVCVRVYYRDRDSAGTLVGSAVAFRLFLFFVPMLLFFTGILGFLAEHIDRADISNAGITGGLASQIESALEQPTSTRWVGDPPRPLRHGVGGPVADEGPRRGQLPGVAAPRQDEGTPQGDGCHRRARRRHRPRRDASSGGSATTASRSRGCRSSWGSASTPSRGSC